MTYQSLESREWEVIEEGGEDVVGVEGGTRMLLTKLRPPIFSGYYLESLAILP